MSEHIREFDGMSPSVTTTVTDQLRAIWSELLFVDADDIDDRSNFVALGGDSIAATLCTMRIDLAFGVDVDMSFLLEDDTNFAMVVQSIERGSTVQE